VPSASRRAFDLSQGAIAKRFRLNPNRLSAGASHMLDVVMLAIGLVFFALSVGYTVACDRL
jgi:hypothetical protein